MVKLEPMTETAFDAWRQNGIKAYAKEKVAAHTWPQAKALAKAAAEYQKLLPQGLKTPNQLLWTITENNAAVGTLWVFWDQPQQSFFIYDIIIAETKRNQGLGQKTLAALTAEAQKLDVSSIGLHVFADNARAHHVYKKMGFVDTDINMVKLIKPDGQKV